MPAQNNNYLNRPLDENRPTLLTTMVDMALSNFVSAKVQQQRGTNEAYQRITNFTKQTTLDTQAKQNPLQNQLLQTGMSTNIGNCQGPVTKIFFVKDTPA